MSSQQSFHKSRFSRRLTLMFIGCALVPIITLAVIAYTGVSRELMAQGRSNIGRAAKAHAIGIYDRLLALQNQMQLIRLSLAHQRGQNLTAALGPMRETLKEQFTAIDYCYGGCIFSLLDETPAVASGPAPHPPQDAAPNVSIQIRKQVALAPPEIIMHLPMGNIDGTTAYLEAVVQPAFLWGLGHANTLPAQTDLVVIDDQQETLINTSELDILAFKTKLKAVAHNRNKGFRYREGQIDHHVSCWPLFLTPKFGIGTWRVSYIKDEAVVLAPIHAFKRSFLLILLLTFWIVLLLSLRYIRKAVGPLKQLHAGTQALVQGNYSHHIEVNSRDEFAQVSAAFNQMTDRIGRQVSGLRTIAEIGRETAAVFEIPALLKIEMDLMAHHLDFHKGLILLEVPGKQYLYCAGHYGFSDPQQEVLNEWHLNLAPHGLNAHPDLSHWFNTSQASSPLEVDTPLDWNPLEELLPSQEVIWVPIVYEKSALGLLGVTRRADLRDAGELDHDLLRGIAAQTAVALQNITAAKQLQQAQKMEAIGTLAGGIAHDFNNILSGIMGFAQLGSLTTKDETANEKFTKIMTASARARDLVQQILTFSRQGEQCRQAIRIDLVLKEALKLLRASIPAHIEMKRYIPVIETCVLADATQMHQIVMNLCTNAYHAMEEKGGLLTVKLGRHTPEAGQPDTPSDLWGVPCLEMTIGDTGSGMDEDTLARIFDPYFTTKPQGKGTGLGLAVVHGIVESHGGSIQVASTPNQGTTFRLLFPEITAEAKAVGETTTLRTSGGERVLLVDDEALIIDMGSEMLAALGYRVTASQDPQEALENLRQDPLGVDLVITDLAMPNLKGDDLARALHDIRGDLPVILCTGFSDPKISCPEADTLFSAQLPKPFTAEGLQKAIQTALAR